MGKRLADPQVSEAKRLRVQLTEACKDKAVTRILQLLQEWESAAFVLPPSSVAHVLSALVACEDGDQTDADACEHFKHAQRIFEQVRADTQNWAGHGESIYTLMVRLASRTGELATATEYLRQMRNPPLSIRPKLRTFIPMLEVCARRGLSDEAEALYRDELFPMCGPADATAAWGTECEDLLWQTIFTLRLRACATVETGGAHAARGGASTRDPAPLSPNRCRRATAVMDDVRRVCPQLREDAPLAEELRTTCSAFGWRTEARVQIGPDGRCPVTATTLRALRPSEADLSSLLELIERLAVENASQRMLDEWVGFKTWLGQGNHRWDTIIDGANVGHYNQNYAQGVFSHMQIEEVIAECELSGGRQVAVVLRDRWLDPRAEFSLPRTKPKRKHLPQLQEKAAGSPDRPAIELAAAEAPMTDAPPVESEAPKQETPPSRENAEVGEVGGGGSVGEAKVEEELTEEQQQVADLVDGWRKRGVLVVSPPSINDDWVALYMALAMCMRSNDREVQFVTNDELRDHFWRMRQPLAFRTWCERHVTHYHVPRGYGARPSHEVEELETEAPIRRVAFSPPLIYSDCAQRDDTGGCWHFPVRPKGVASGGCPATEDSVVGMIIGPPRRSTCEWLVAWDPACMPSSSSQPGGASVSDQACVPAQASRSSPTYVPAQASVQFPCSVPSQLSEQRQVSAVTSVSVQAPAGKPVPSCEPSPA